MKKKYITASIASCFLAVSLLMTGCNLSDDQIKVVAQNAGLAASITWIAYDNPDNTAKGLLGEALSVVKTNIVSIQEGKTYMESLYPQVEIFVRSDSVPDQYEPLVLAGSMASLNALDLLFLTNPEWKSREQLTLGVVNSFIFGVKNGLGLDGNDPLVIQANIVSSKRSRVFKD